MSDAIKILKMKLVWSDIPGGADTVFVFEQGRGWIEWNVKKLVAAYKELAEDYVRLEGAVRDIKHEVSTTEDTEMTEDEEMARLAQLKINNDARRMGWNV